MRDRAAHKPTLPTATEPRRFGEWPTLAERVEKLEAATARPDKQIGTAERAAIKSRSDELPTLGCARDGDADVLADLANLLATVIELKDDQAELREIVANLSKQISRKPLPRRLPAGWATLKTAAGVTGYAAETIRLWAVADKNLGRRLGGQWIVKLDRLPKRDAERS